MSEEKKSPPKKTESKPADSKAAKPEGKTEAAGWKAGQNGKGDGPRNNLSESFRSNFDAIDWGK